MENTNQVAIPSNPEDREKIFRVMKTISDSLTRIEGERELIKEEINALSKEYNIPKKFLNRLARTYHKQNFNQVVNEQENFEMLYESIIESKNQ